jgi:hypothetical protein
LISFVDTNDEFKRFCGNVTQILPEVEKKMQRGYFNGPSSEMYCLAVACDLKRNRKTLEPILEKFILDLYAKLYLAADISPPPPKPSKEVKLASKVMQRALAITKTVGKEKNEPEVIQE